MFHVLCTSSFLSLISSAFPFSLIGSVLKQFSSFANRTICFCLSVRCDGKKFHYVCMVNNNQLVFNVRLRNVGLTSHGSCTCIIDYLCMSVTHKYTHAHTRTHAQHACFSCCDIHVYDVTAQQKIRTGQSLL